MTIDDVVNAMSSEEQEEFKDLIKECRVREKTNKRNREQIDKGLKILFDSLKGELAEKLWCETCPENQIGMA